MRIVGIDGFRILVDVLDDALLVDHERGAVGHRELGIEDAVFLRDLAGKVAQKWEVHANLLGICLVGKLAVYAHTQDLRARTFEFGDISLIRLEFLRSATRESQDVKRQHHVLLA